MGLHFSCNNKNFFSKEYRFGVLPISLLNWAYTRIDNPAFHPCCCEADAVKQGYKFHM